MRHSLVLLLFTTFMSARTNVATAFPDTAELQKVASRFVPTPLTVDIARLHSGDRKALVKLIEAGHVIDDMFLQQLWSGNEKLYRQLRQDTSPLGRARLHMFWINKGPWSDLDAHRAFLPGVPERKPLGANFYPEDMTREEFEHWVAGLPEKEGELAKSFFTVIRRDPQNRHLETVPYYREYHDDLQRAANLLREAAALTQSTSLRRFLEMRAAAFLNDDYYASDLAWMDVDAPVDVTIGPYETYNDELFGYKAAFEAYICIRDDAETEKLKDFSRHLQEVENNLPVELGYRNPKLGAATPIRVVNEVFSAGDGNHGVETAAFNLPNDERVIQQKGSKKVMLKNVQHAKFDDTLIPISRVVLSVSAQPDLSFDWFFTHILAHELSHGIGPHEIKINGKTTSVRQQLKELYSTIEEAKADVTGLFMVQYFFDKGILRGGEENERKLYNTFLASSFRTLRFGITEAHGQGMALQFNYLMQHGAFVARPDGSFDVNYATVKQAVRDLTHDLLTVEAQGDYAAAKKMLEELGVVRPDLARALDRLKGIPVDIEPVFITADELTGHQQ
ncbi:MAG: dipeptidyl-peptidase 3 family protein [Bryobacteraceae bacterium]